MIRVIVCVVGWFALMFASLQIQHIDIGHALCGKWGCGPPASALFSVHLFWFSLLLPPAMLLMKKWKLNWQLIGVAMVALTLLVLVVFAAADFLGANRSYYLAGYWWQRYLLSLASWINVPVVQLGTIGGIMIRFGRCPCCAGPGSEGSVVVEHGA